LCDWTTIREIATSLGEVLKVDWQALFSSFFSMIKVKINSKDPTKIPQQRVLELYNYLYLISYRVEGLEQKSEKPEDDDKDNGGDNLDDEDLLDDDLGDNNKEGDWTPKRDNSRMRLRRRTQNPSQKHKPMNRMLQLFEMVIENNQEAEESFMPRCIDLLQAMELEESENEEEGNQLVDLNGDNDLVTLPDQWIYPDLDGQKKVGEVVEMENCQSQMDIGSVDQMGDDRADEARRKRGRTSKANKWGPMKVERKSKRNTNDPRTMTERAQDTKRKRNEEDNKGKHLLLLCIILLLIL
ncbi:hypothetical protein BAE44_0017889, partial [Dichanthelium oligosanthes]